MNALLVKDGTIERVEIGSDYREIQKHVGGTFGQCFAAPGAGQSRKIIGWCNDEFLLMPPDQRPAWNVFLCDQTLYRGGYAIGGPILIVGHIGPDACSMTEIELSAFRIATDRRWVGTPHGIGDVVTLPVLRFVPGYDTDRDDDDVTPESRQREKRSHISRGRPK